MIDSFSAFVSSRSELAMKEMLKSNLQWSVYVQTTIAYHIESSSLTDNFHEQHNAFAFIVEFLGLLVCLLTAGLCLLSHLCAIIWDIPSVPNNEKFRVPFPLNKGLNKLVSMFTYLDFCTFLTALIGVFAAFMLVTTNGLRYHVYANQYGLNQTMDIVSVLNKSVLQSSPRLCKINHITGLLNSVLIVICNLTILAIVTNLTGRFKRKSNKRPVFRIPSEASLITKDIWVYLRLSRLILSLSSILITVGGLILLGWTLQIISLDNEWLIYMNGSSTDTVVDGLSLTVGLFSIGAGLFSVIAVQCCSTPIDVVFDPREDSQSQAEWSRHKFGHPLYLVAVILTLSVLPLSAGVYFLLRINVIRYHSRSIKQSSSTLASQKLEGIGYALLNFADLAAYLVAGSLLTTLIIDLVVRIKLLDGKRSGGPNTTWTDTNATSMGLTCGSVNSCNHLRVNAHQLNCSTASTTDYWKGTLLRSPSGKLLTTWQTSQPNTRSPVEGNCAQHVFFPPVYQPQVHSLGHGFRKHTTEGQTRFGRQHKSLQHSISAYPEVMTYQLPESSKPQTQMTQISPPVSSGNVESHLVYTCANISPTQTSTLKTGVVCAIKCQTKPPNFINSRRTDTCEYMSCDLIRPEQAAAVDSEIIPFGFDLDGQPGCSIGYYYIDATSEDLITKV
ncbi:hypothetical protein EG68_00545 [Paragonimus skrjabini miyazakii]|uniref:Uncharacterized protein n=1 Tax=Paragonimus skrjabini miyazakii TaxID=59628 RepID=A0A8S9ZCM8_9TREM|nr:hypothetical protein EG68_00545 [Paragonimus skrjabini miyazakii]